MNGPLNNIEQICTVITQITFTCIFHGVYIFVEGFKDVGEL